MLILQILKMDMDGKNYLVKECVDTSQKILDYLQVLRYHNVYGPLGTFDGGREKAPAALM